MNIFVVNCGSSSVKFQLFNMEKEIALCSGQVERIGQESGILTYKKSPDTADEKKHTIEAEFKNHIVSMEAVIKLLTDKEWGVVKSLDEISAAGHRVVQGGELLQSSCVVTADVKKKIEEMIPLAPLHNPPNLEGIEVIQKLLPNAPSVAVFDTEFHATIPAKAYMYAIPYELYEDLHIRRYGFHGTSHRYVTEKTAEVMGIPLDKFNAITCHLGNGSSISAVQGGKCVDTSMGMTPLAGLIMGTRCGDIDPAIYTFLSENKGWSAAQVDEIANKKSGFMGLCGMSDMRDIHEAAANGDEKAKLAVDMFVYSLVKYIGSYKTVVGDLNAIIFTAGIGENDDIVRKLVCNELNKSMGIVIDEEINAKRSGECRIITKPESKVQVFITPTNEELAIARATKKVVEKA